MNTDKKSKIDKALFTKIVVGVFCAIIVGWIIFMIVSANKVDNLIERDNHANETVGIKTEPTPEEYNEMLPSVIKRVTSSRDSSLELPQIKTITDTLDALYETRTTIAIDNYLGGFKVICVLTLNKETNITELHKSALEILSPILDITPDFTRLEVQVFTGSDTIEKFYLNKGDAQEITDVRYNEPAGLVKLEKHSLLTKTQKLAEEFISLTSECRILENEEQYDLYVNLEPVDTADVTNDVVDLVDRQFMLINEHADKPVHLHISLGTTLQFMGYVDPQSQAFKNFYTDKVYFQDISRAEYYRCNGWLYGNTSSFINTLLDQLY